MGLGNKSLFGASGSHDQDGCHIHIWAVTFIYGKNASKIFFSGTKKGQWPYGLVCSIGAFGPNDEPKLTLTYFTARSNLVSYSFIWEKLLENHLMEVTYSKWPKWQFKGLSAPAPGLYTHIKTWKIMYKIRLQKIFFWNLQQMGEVTRLFCWHKDFDHKGLSAPAPGLYSCGKT